MEKAPPLVLLGGADAHDLVLVEMLIDDYPNIIFVVLTSLNPIIPLGPRRVALQHLKSCEDTRFFLLKPQVCNRGFYCGKETGESLTDFILKEKRRKQNASSAIRINL